jgi:hypothetical protein
MNPFPRWFCHRRISAPTRRVTITRGSRMSDTTVRSRGWSQRSRGGARGDAQGGGRRHEEELGEAGSGHGGVEPLRAAAAEEEEAMSTPRPAPARERGVAQGVTAQQNQHTIKETAKQPQEAGFVKGHKTKNQRKQEPQNSYDRLQEGSRTPSENYGGLNSRTALRNISTSSFTAQATRNTER